MIIAKQNSVYAKTEKRILKALYKVLKHNRSISLRVRTLTRETGIATSSFYIHYNSLTDLLDVNERRILGDLDKTIRMNMKNENQSEEKFYCNILICLYRYRELLKVFFITENFETPLKAIRHMKPFAVRRWNNYGLKTNEFIYEHYAYSVLAELNLWYKENFDFNRLEKHANHIAKINRLIPTFYTPIYS